MRPGGSFLLLALFFVFTGTARADGSANSCATGLAQAEASLKQDFTGYEASVLVQKGDQKLILENFGTGITEHTRFLLGSVSKPLHAAIAIQFLNEGSIGLESAISSELSQEDASELPAAWASVRVRNLFHHTSGIPDYLNRPDPTSQSATDLFLKTAHDFASLIGFLPPTLDFEPDTQYVYSNTNYLILDQILEDKSGLSDQELMKERLTGPLAMTDTGTLMGWDSSVLGGTGVFPSNMQGVGNVYSTTTDLMKFLRALDPDAGSRLIPQEWIQKMFEADPACHGNGCDRYGLGISLFSSGIGNHFWVAHQGHLNSVSSLVAKVPDLGANMTIVSDKPGINTEMVAESVINTLIKYGCF